MRAGRVNAEMVVRERRSHATAGSAIEEPDLDQVGLDNLFDGVLSS